MGTLIRIFVLEHLPHFGKRTSVIPQKIVSTILELKGRLWHVIAHCNVYNTNIKLSYHKNLLILIMSYVIQIGAINHYGGPHSFAIILLIKVQKLIQIYISHPELCQKSSFGTQVVYMNIVGLLVVKR